MILSDGGAWIPETTLDLRNLVETQAYTVRIILDQVQQQLGCFVLALARQGPNCSDRLREQPRHHCHSTIDRASWRVPDCLTLNPHERESLPHRRIHTADLGQNMGGGRRRWGASWQIGDRRTLRRTALRYRRGTRKQKAQILDEFVENHECTRNHASWLLRSWGKTVFSHQGGQLVKIVVGQRRARRTVPRVYDQQVYEALEKIWYLYGGMCGKRLIGVLRHQLPLLEKFGEVQASGYRFIRKAPGLLHDLVELL